MWHRSYLICCLRQIGVYFALDCLCVMKIMSLHRSDFKSLLILKTASRSRSNSNSKCCHKTCVTHWRQDQTNYWLLLMISLSMFSKFSGNSQIFLRPWIVQFVLFSTSTIHIRVNMFQKTQLSKLNTQASALARCTSEHQLYLKERFHTKTKIYIDLS